MAATHADGCFIRLVSALDKEELQELVNRGLSQSQIAKAMDVTTYSVRYFLKKYDLKTKHTPSVIDVDKVRELAPKAQSYANLMRLMGISVHTSNYKRLRRIVQKHDIDVSHFDERPRKHKRGISNEELFSKSRDHSFSTVRYHVIRDNLIPMDKCAICGMEPVWNGKPLTFRLDHINGDHYDNRLDNLRFICANCDSQLDTYCHKNRRDNK